MLVICGGVRSFTTVTTRVIVRALHAFEAFLLLAWHRLVQIRMKQLLFPPVTVAAGLESLTAFLVAGDERAALPVFTQGHLVGEQIWSATEILEIMSVYTLCFVMFLVEWAPLCLEVKHVEVKIWLAAMHIFVWICNHLVDQTHLDIFNRVSKAAKVAILTLADLVRVEVAELSLVLVTVVKSFDPIVSSFATIVLWTPVSLGKFAKLWRVEPIRPSLVLLRMIEVARLVVVSQAAAWTLQNLKLTQDEVTDQHWLLCPVMDLERLEEDLLSS